MTEWLKVADCKSVRVSYVGSNPTFFIIDLARVEHASKIYPLGPKLYYKPQHITNITHFNS